MVADKRHPSPYLVGNTDYGVMGQIFQDRIRESDVLVDVGCGNGRVINWWLSRGLRNKIIGVEIQEEVAKRTRRRLRRYPNVEIITGDAVENLPPDGTLFYLANPFDATTVRRFKAKMREHCARRDDIRIIYYACVQVGVFSEDPSWSIEEFVIARPALAVCFEERHSRLGVIRYVGEPSDRVPGYQPRS